MRRVPQHAGQAIALMLGGVFMFSGMDVAIKLLVEDFPSMQVMFLRCGVSAVLFLAWILATDRRQFRTAYPVGHLVRAAVGLVMLYTVGECFRELYLPDAYAIFFAAPLLVTLLSGPVLGEPAGAMRTAAAAVGFVGVLIVLKPSGEGWISYGGLMGVIAMVLYAASILLVRRLGERDGSVTIAFWFTLLVGAGAGLAAIPGWRPVLQEHWATVAIMGLTGTLGQVLLTAAFRRASAAVIAPFDYTHMIWAVLYSYLIWDFLPTGRTWIGAAIVIASGLAVIYREQRALKRRPVPLPPDTP